jgi:hypothetical protein
MRQHLKSTLRTAVAALGVLTSCLMAVANAEAAPAHRTHTRARCAVCRRVVSPKQAFARIATRRPDRFLRRHVSALLRQARTNGRGSSGDAAIQNDVSAVGIEADTHASPAFELVGVLIAEHSPLRPHEVFGRRSPRGPPAFS